LLHHWATSEYKWYYILYPLG